MFVVSKLLSAITQPMFWLVLWWGAGLLLLSRRRRMATGMLWAGLAALGLLGFQAPPDALLRALENRHAAPAAAELGRHAGVIVLGGVLGDADIHAAHGQVPLGEAAERIVAPLALLRRHPQMDLVFAGGEGRLLQRGVPEASLAEVFLREQGIDLARVRFENRSRNTRENARNVAALLGERCAQPWLLVTSAAHMPRALDEFRHAGCAVTPYPVDFSTGASTPWTRYSLAGSLVRWQAALHEWLGLAVYAATRTAAR